MTYQTFLCSAHSMSSKSAEVNHRARSKAKKNTLFGRMLDRKTNNKHWYVSVIHILWARLYDPKHLFNRTKMSNKEPPIPKTLGTHGDFGSISIWRGCLFVHYSVVRLTDRLTFEVCKTKWKKEKEKRQQSVKMFKSEKVHIIKMWSVPYVVYRSFDVLICVYIYCFER